MIGKSVPMKEQGTNCTFNNAIHYKVIFQVKLSNHFLKNKMSFFFVSGEQARDFFVKSSLPGDILRKIW